MPDTRAEHGPPETPVPQNLMLVDALVWVDSNTCLVPLTKTQPWVVEASLNMQCAVEHVGTCHQAIVLFLRILRTYPSYLLPHLPSALVWLPSSSFPAKFPSLRPDNLKLLLLSRHLFASSFGGSWGWARWNVTPPCGSAPASATELTFESVRRGETTSIGVRVQAAETCHSKPDAHNPRVLLHDSPRTERRRPRFRRTGSETPARVSQAPSADLERAGMGKLAMPRCQYIVGAAVAARSPDLARCN